MTSTKQLETNAKLVLSQAGLRLTKPRLQMVMYLITEKIAQSPYQIQEVLLSNYKVNLSAMTVYRILRSFEEKNLAHYIARVNKFIACSHLACDHPHGNSQFLICNHCQSVTEILLPQDISNQIVQFVDQTGFQIDIHKTTMEIDGICKVCLQTNEE